MLLKKENEYGSIGYDKAVITKIIEEIAAGYGDRVFIANHKGKYVPAGKRHKDMSDAIEFSYNNEKLEIKLYLVLKFGMSITKTSMEMIEKIRRQLREILEIETATITVEVVGMASRNSFRKSSSSIEVKG
ncbi:MAG: Asp23/Gls24 family envelope stress response protein [Clostridia bacterium]|nr:Asp23/Gls24 family envelope stress response protein [Clostridia bacterium]